MLFWSYFSRNPVRIKPVWNVFKYDRIQMILTMKPKNDVNDQFLFKWWSVNRDRGVQSVLLDCLVYKLNVWYVSSAAKGLAIKTITEFVYMLHNKQLWIIVIHYEWLMQTVEGKNSRLANWLAVCFVFFLCHLLFAPKVTAETDKATSKVNMTQLKDLDCRQDTW